MIRKTGSGTALLFAVLTMIQMTGCSKLPECLIFGQLEVDGKLTEGVYVVFYTAGTTDVASAASGAARTDAEGRFDTRVTKPGTYTITAFWPATVMDDGQATEGKDQFEGRYRNLQAPVMSYKIEPGNNTLPQLKLNSK